MAKKKPAKKKAAAKPAATGIEAAADAAAESEPTEVKAAAPSASAKAEDAAADPGTETIAVDPALPASERKPQTDAKHGTDTQANQDHLAAKLESRELAEPAKPGKVSKEVKAKQKLREETRARLDEIRDELAALESTKRELIDEQNDLANPAAVPDGMTFIERLRQVQARTTENRERRARDRLTLLAIGAGKSPLDRAMGGGKRKSPADADKKE